MGVGGGGTRAAPLQTQRARAAAAAPPTPPTPPRPPEGHGKPTLAPRPTPPPLAVLFSTERNGCSLRQAYLRLDGHGPTLLAVLDSSGAIFGAFVTESWRVSPHYCAPPPRGGTCASRGAGVAQAQGKALRVHGAGDRHIAATPEADAGARHQRDCRTPRLGTQTARESPSCSRRAPRAPESSRGQAPTRTSSWARQIASP